MTDDDTSPDADAVASNDDTKASAAAETRASEGVSVPRWLAAALVVVLGITIGAAGFAIGRATGDDNGRFGNPELIGSRGQTDGPGGIGNGPRGRGNGPFGNEPLGNGPRRNGPQQGPGAGNGDRVRPNAPGNGTRNDDQNDDQNHRGDQGGQQDGPWNREGSGRPSGPGF